MDILGYKGYHAPLGVPIATGGLVNIVGNLKSHTFLANGIFNISGFTYGGGRSDIEQNLYSKNNVDVATFSSVAIQFVIVAGGGGGSTANGGGGGGSGGVFFGGLFTTGIGNYNVTVGAGGAAGVIGNPGNSSFIVDPTGAPYIALYGGGGANGAAGAFAGAGGGGSAPNGVFELGTFSQGSNGATASATAGAGGGSTNIALPPGNGVGNNGGVGGSGFIYMITGVPLQLGGGGGGGAGAGGIGGAGGGSGGGAGGNAGGNGANGLPNTGGGGGGKGAGGAAAGAGGSGIVIIAYLIN